MAYRNYSVANGFVVDKLGNGDFTTIAAALTAATSGTTIFIRPGTYTENPTLVAGVSLTAFDCNASLNQTGNVIISGKCTFTTAGTVTISGIQLQTNSDFLLAVTGSVASIVNLINCNLNCTNNTGISFSTSSSSGAINCYNCTGNLGTTGIGLYSHSSAGNLTFKYSNFTNSGASTTASSNSAGNVIFQYNKLFLPIGTSSTGAIVTSHYNEFDTSAQNTTCVTTAGSGTSGFNYCRFVAGSASAISIGVGTVVNLQGVIVDSTNTNAITGAGSYTISNANFPNTSHQVNVTTQAGGGATAGLTQGTGPGPGSVGEQIRSFVALASAVVLSNNTAANITSINLTAGIWDVSGVITFHTTSITGVYVMASVSTTSATIGTEGDNRVDSAATPTTTADTSVIVPAFRITLASTTPTYLVAQAGFSAGNCSGFGRISATRVG